jgi:hypothetical protein
LQASGHSEDRETAKEITGSRRKTMFAYTPRRGTDPKRIHPRTASPKAGTRIRRLAAVLAVTTAALMSSVAAIPAAFARVIPPPGGSFGPSSVAPVQTSAVRVVTSGTPGWQIALIALGAALLGAAAAVLLGHVLAGRRAASALAA